MGSFSLLLANLNSHRDTYRECGLDSALGSMNLNSDRDKYGPSCRVVELEESAIVIDNGQGRRILNIRQASA